MSTHENSINSTAVRWRRTFVEAVAITLSILLAFAIDASWDSYKERNQESAFLESLLRDFKETRGRIDTSIADHEGFINSARQLLSLKEDDVSKVEPSELETLLGAVFFDWRSLYVSNGSLSALFASGDIQIISDERLRAMLAAWPSQVADAVEDEVWIANDVGRSLAPYLHGKVRTRNVSHYTNANSAKFIPELESVDYAALWRDPQFDNLVAYRIMNEMYAIEDISRLGEAADEIIHALESELAR